MYYIRSLLKAITRLYPLYSGRAKIANSRWLKSVLKNAPPTLWVRLKQGPWILIITNDFIGRALYYFGDLDSKITWVCQRVLRPGDTVLDIGANLGVYSFVSRQLVGNQGQIHAFEPQPKLVDCLNQSLVRNGYSNVFVHNVALGEETKLVELLVPEHHYGGASLIHSRSECHRQKKEKQLVRVENTADYLYSLGLSSIRLVKIDVEGYEAEVIKGASTFLRAMKPDMILFEIPQRGFPFCEQPVIKLLAELNYVFFNLPKARLRMYLQRIEADSTSLQYNHDILAIQESCEGALQIIGSAKTI